MDDRDRNYERVLNNERESLNSLCSGALIKRRGLIRGALCLPLYREEEVERLLMTLRGLDAAAPSRGAFINARGHNWERR